MCAASHLSIPHVSRASQSQLNFPHGLITQRESPKLFFQLRPLPEVGKNIDGFPETANRLLNATHIEQTHTQPRKMLGQRLTQANLPIKLTRARIVSGGKIEPLLTYHTCRDVSKLDGFALYIAFDPVDLQRFLQAPQGKIIHLELTVAEPENGHIDRVGARILALARSSDGSLREAQRDKKSSQNAITCCDIAQGRGNMIRIERALLKRNGRFEHGQRFLNSSKKPEHNSPTPRQWSPAHIVGQLMFEPRQPLQQLVIAAPSNHPSLRRINQAQCFKGPLKRDHLPHRLKKLG